MKALLVSVAVLSVAALIAAEPDTSKVPQPAAKKYLTYAKDIKPILEKACLNCHGPEKPKSKYRVDSREAIIKGGDSDEAAIIPGKSEKSPMIHYVADLVVDMEMPPTDKREKYPAWTKDQIALVRAWIDQGAK